jgi:magnesium-transporting ATPase (P-type)
MIARDRLKVLAGKGDSLVPDQQSVAARQPVAMPTPMSQLGALASHSDTVDAQGNSASTPDPEEAADRLLRDLRSSAEGLSTRDADRCLLQYGPNTLQSRHKRQWPAELVRQFTRPPAPLLWLAAGLLLIVGSNVVAATVVSIIGLNAAFSFAQELQAERAVEERRRTSRCADRTWILYESRRGVGRPFPGRQAGHSA